MSTITATLPDTTKHTPLRVYVDASHNHKSGGISSLGWAIQTHGGEFIDVNGEDLGRLSNSHAAEEEALKRVIKKLRNHSQVKHIKVFSDCKPAVKRFNKNGVLEQGFEQVTLNWIPREKNLVADMSSRLWHNGEQENARLSK